MRREKSRRKYRRQTWAAILLKRHFCRKGLHWALHLDGTAGPTSRPQPLSNPYETYVVWLASNLRMYSLPSLLEHKLLGEVTWSVSILAVSLQGAWYSVWHSRNICVVSEWITAVISWVLTMRRQWLWRCLRNEHPRGSYYVWSTVECHKLCPQSCEVRWWFPSFYMWTKREAQRR